MQYSTVILPCLRVAFVGTLLIFFIAWLSKKILCTINAWRKSNESRRDGDTKQKEAEYDIKQDAWKDMIQQKYQEKVANYKDNVLIPREKKNRERIEKTFHQQFGQLWNGEGDRLGGEDDSSGDENNDWNRSENKRAARRRNLPEPELRPTTECLKPTAKPKRVIELPDELGDTDPESILIVIRTPISTLVTRRFHPSHSFQNVLDFMTKSGFSEHLYQLCTSFPRHVLSPDPKVPLSHLGFAKRVTLNIKSKSDDD